MSLVYDHAQTPVGGYLFPDPSGYIISAKTLRELVEKIKTYRASNGFLTGSPEAELETYYIQEAPWLVSKTGVAPLIKEDAFLAWLKEAWRTPTHKFAETETANKRMAICRQCPHYDSAHVFDMDTHRRLMILGAGKLQAAGVCSAHHWACGLACVQDEPRASWAVEGCWAKAK